MQSMNSRQSQRGAVVVLVAVAMTALIMMAGLALDMGHAFLNKSRLQNTVDAAALAAAKRLDETGSTALATAQKAQYVESMHSVFILAEGVYTGYNTPANVRSKLGI